MIELPAKANLFGVEVSITNYQGAVDVILDAAKTRRSLAVSALAVHGLIEAVNDPVFRDQVNSIDLTTPDGQPVKWALNALHGAQLEDRVYGPDLTWYVIEASAAAGVGIFLFGSTQETCDAFAEEIVRRFPTAVISGIQADRFREATPDEDFADINAVNASGAGVVLVGRGCPRQERWVADHRGKVNAAMLAVGAAFDYGAGQLDPPPAWMQRSGLQWLYRLGQEPGRLWKRYLFTNSQFVFEFSRARLKKSLSA